jgi:hypothetical protein
MSGALPAERSDADRADGRQTASGSAAATASARAGSSVRTRPRPRGPDRDGRAPGPSKRASRSRPARSARGRDLVGRDPGGIVRAGRRLAGRAGRARRRATRSCSTCAGRPRHPGQVPRSPGTRPVDEDHTRAVGLRRWEISPIVKISASARPTVATGRRSNERQTTSSRSGVVHGGRCTAPGSGPRSPVPPDACLRYPLLVAD